MGQTLGTTKIEIIQEDQEEEVDVEKENEYRLYNNYRWCYQTRPHTYFRRVPSNGLFEVLPVEIITHILSYVPILDSLRNVPRVCRLLNNVSSKDNDHFWRQIVTEHWKELATKIGFGAMEVKDMGYVSQSQGYHELCKQLLMEDKESKGKWKVAQWFRRGVKYHTQYIGGRENGKREGYGVGKFRNGEYRGQWKNDKLEGRGVFEISNSGKTTVYKGQWKNDKEEGHGVYEENIFMKES
eukprot:TRINITY_DN1269_c0_g1_i1.p1 TRINITY_DN1269_c0_g1~~TRINITY_DN1269_c0_g1_i1.p1  ORF type:complete len:240 (-),score=43.98 TRINITY_DN1269_c0_g1_i1:571-1290(-)